MEYTREEIGLATYLFWSQFADDPNVELTAVEIQAKYAEVRVFMTAVPSLIQILRESTAVAEADIMTHFYDIGKQYFGEEKQQLFRFFALLYMTIWGKPNGPRFGAFGSLFGGCAAFADLIEEKYNAALTWI